MLSRSGTGEVKRGQCFELLGLSLTDDLRHSERVNIAGGGFRIRPAHRAVCGAEVDSDDVAGQGFQGDVVAGFSGLSAGRV